MAITWIYLIQHVNNYFTHGCTLPQRFDILCFVALSRFHGMLENYIQMYSEFSKRFSSFDVEEERRDTKPKWD